MKTLKTSFFCCFALLKSFASDVDGDLYNSNITFCNEPVPVYQKKVSAQFQEQLAHTAAQPLYKIIPRAKRFMKVITPVFQEYNIPADLIYLCIAESTLQSGTTSSKGARGYWQFMPETAVSLGLKVDSLVDERMNLMKSTEAACRYFRELYSQLGSWTLVAAAYNVGPTRVKNYIALRGNRNYYDWNINKENRQYVFRVMAIKEMMTRPQAYSVMLRDSIDLQTHLKRDGVVLGLLKEPKITTYSPILTKLFFVNESVIGGFQNLMSVAVKMCGTTLNNRLQKIQRELDSSNMKTIYTTIKQNRTLMIRPQNLILVYRKEDVFFPRFEQEYEQRFYKELPLNTALV